jgi:hypothetical protein
MYGVLGISKLEDEEGSSAYLYGKDVQRSKSSLMHGFFPNLYQEHESSKRNFYASMEDHRRQIEDNDNLIR